MRSSQAGNFESVVSYGIGLARTPVRAPTAHVLAGPTAGLWRWYLDIPNTGTPATTTSAVQATDPGHVILKAGNGTIALATTGKAGSLVYAGRFRASNPAEDWGADHVPGGRFGLYWAPRGTDR